MRNAIAKSLQVFLNKPEHINYIDRFILNVFKKCKKILRDNSDVFVTKADKGQITIFMDKNDYIHQMINDHSTYKSLKKTLLINYQRNLIHS